MTDHDRTAWASYVRHVAPLAGIAPARPAVLPADLAVPPGPDSDGPTPPTAAAIPAPKPRRALAPIEVGAAPGGVDRATWTRFRAGKLAPSRTLDLHGRTAHRAHADLHAFVAGAIADRIRCVEIITGRGSGESGGVIRREFPLWLNDGALRPLILAASHPHPANPGSVRLLLRRVR